MAGAGCLCGAVTWELAGPYTFMSHCHCARCRKSHGTAFATYVGAPADRFRLHGAEHVVRWASSPAVSRCFCERCGSIVPGPPADGLVFAPAGNFTADPGERPVVHIFAGSKAPWYEITDPLPRFEAYPPGIDAPVLPDRPPIDPPGKIRGSCICGAAAFVLEAPPSVARYCHCSRCRRGRSAAHAANLTTPTDGVRFTRGEDQLGSYKLPEARFFTQVFCRTCGACMPRIDPGRNLAVVPMGALDDDPGIRPAYHIFVGSKAPWFEIHDALPQYEEYPPGA